MEMDGKWRRGGGGRQDDIGLSEGGGSRGPPPPSERPFLPSPIELAFPPQRVDEDPYQRDRVYPSPSPGSYTYSRKSEQEDYSYDTAPYSGRGSFLFDVGPSPMPPHARSPLLEHQSEPPESGTSWLRNSFSPEETGRWRRPPSALHELGGDAVSNSSGLTEDPTVGSRFGTSSGTGSAGGPLLYNRDTEDSEDGSTLGSETRSERKRKYVCFCVRRAWVERGLRGLWARLSGVVDVCSRRVTWLSDNVFQLETFLLS